MQGNERGVAQARDRVGDKMNDAVKKAKERYPGETCLHGTDDFIIMFAIYGVGNKKAYFEDVKAASIDGIKVLFEENVGVKRPEAKINSGDYFTWHGFAYLMYPLADMDLIGPVVKASIVEYTIKQKKDESEDEFSEIYDTFYKSEEEKAFFSDPTARTLVLEDNRGDCLCIATCGKAEGRRKYVEDFEANMDLSSLMVKTADPFGDF